MNGRLISEKQLATEPSCEAMAETAAVVLAAWAVQLQADTGYAFEMPATDRARVDKPAAPQQQVVAATALPAPVTPVQHWATTVGGGALASFQATTFAPALALDVRARPTSSRWGGKLALIGTAAHEQSLEPGKATWRRLGGALGVFRHQAWRRLTLDAGIDLTPAILLVEGSGYTQAHSTHAWDLGAAAGVRLGLVLGRVEPWIEAGATAWLFPQVVEVTGLAQEQRLPRVEAVAGAGISIHWQE